MGYKDNFKLIDWSKKAESAPRQIEYIEVQRSDFPRPMVVRDYQAYECPVTGQMIEGRHAHKENLKRTDCRLLEPGEFEDTKKNGQKRIYDKMDAAIDKAIDEVALTI